MSFRVTRELVGRHPLHSRYPLLPGDILVRDEEHGWIKVAPGLAVFGFDLTEADVETLEEGDFKWVVE